MAETDQAPRQIWIEFGGDPSNDKEIYKRYSATTSFEPLSPSEEVIHCIEMKAFTALQEENRKLKEAYGVLREGLKFYSTKEEKVVGQIEWNPHVCDSYSGLMYAPDWDGDLQDDPGEIAQKAIAKAEEILSPTLNSHPESDEESF